MSKTILHSKNNFIQSLQYLFLKITNYKYFNAKIINSKILIIIIRNYWCFYG